MPFTPEEFTGNSPCLITAQDTDNVWRPLYRQACAFKADAFVECMMNMIKNPNLNSSWLFRADILYDSEADSTEDLSSDLSQLTLHQPQSCPMTGFTSSRRLVRRLIPRNDRRDKPMEQTCEIHTSVSDDGNKERAMIVYLPHIQTPEDIPFYHPKVRGIAHLHEWDTEKESGAISVHFLGYPSHDVYEKKTQKIAFHLLEILDKHGRSRVNGGYVKRVQHDLIVPQGRFQNRYSALKNKYARSLIVDWAEQTDPDKHVFEDLGIASFLMELWAELYKDTEFPGFVDIGCGNGLLVYILQKEGYKGWGFDARRRKSWAQYTCDSAESPSGVSLEELFLLPDVTVHGDEAKDIDPARIHNGVFPKGTFIISNHADELTPWTPILAAISQCPFIMIPCCSHNLTGDRYRAPPPRDKTKGKSTYASLVDWVARIGEDCGWQVETEMLRIPSTRNTSLLGRTRTVKAEEFDLENIIRKYGGTQGFAKNIAKLASGAAQAH